MSTIIFDFDGTIADSLPVVLEMFYEWARVEPYSSDQIERLRNMNLKQVLREVRIPLWRVPSLLVKARTKFGKHLDEVQVFSDMPEILKKIHNEGHSLYVMSSNSPQNIRQFLKMNKIDMYFSGIHGNTGLFGKAKALRQIVRKYKIMTSDCYAVGDETRDIDAANKVKITSIAVSWGYNADKALKAHNPTYMVSKPAQILELLQ